jgi:hypothetical protein
MVRYRKGSKKAQLHAAYSAGGEAAAITLGTTLGVKAGRVKRWIRQWSSPTVSRTPRKATVRMGTMRGRVIEAGPQQSLVRWEDGHEQHVVNSWIEPTEE